MNKYRGVEYDREEKKYRAWIHTLPCRCWHMGDGCDGVIEAHHAGDRGLGQKAHYLTMVPMCTKHHRAWHDANGLFKDWKKGHRRTWIEGAIKGTRIELTGSGSASRRKEHRRRLIADRVAARRDS